MRVAVIGTYPLSVFADQLGVTIPQGTRESLWHIPLADGLASLPEIELHVLITSARLPKSTVIVNDRNVHFHFLKVPKGSKLLTAYQIDRYVIHRALRRISPDIVHGHSTEHGFPYIAMTSGFPNVVHFHNVLFLLQRQYSRGISLKRQIQQRILLYLERLTLRNAQDIIVASPFMKSLLQPRTRAVIHVVTHSTIANQHFQACHEEVGKRVIYVGDVRPEKRMLDSVKAIQLVREHVPNVDLRFVGYALNQEYYNKMRTYIAENGLKCNVHFVVWLDTRGVIEEMRQASVLLLLSSHEPLGLVLSEAMSVCTPVVATNVGGIPHVIGDNETCFVVEVGDVEAIAAKIRLLLEEDALRRQFGHRGREEALRRFHPTMVATKMVDVYKQVLRRQ